MDFSKKWLRNHQKILLHFLIHIDVLMLCSKFELIPLRNFYIMIVQKLFLSDSTANHKIEPRFVTSYLPHLSIELQFVQ